MADNYNELTPVYQAIGGSRMYSHEYIEEGLSVTVYENGAKVYVNFNKAPRKLPDGSELAAESFAVRGGN